MKYISQQELIKSGLLDYDTLVDDVKRSLIAHQKRETHSEKIAIDFRYGHKILSSIVSGIEYSCCKWLGANIQNHDLGLQRSYPMIFLNDKTTEDQRQF